MTVFVFWERVPGEALLGDIAIIESLRSVSHCHWTDVKLSSSRLARVLAVAKTANGCCLVAWNIVFNKVHERHGSTFSSDSRIVVATWTSCNKCSPGTQTMYWTDDATAHIRSSTSSALLSGLRIGRLPFGIC